MAALEVIALDTSVPQLMAPQAGDTYTFPRAVEMPLGTANGVLYLDGSKVVTSGSALTFNGSTLATTGALTVDGNVTLGNASTDTVQVNGYMAIGGAASSTVAMYVRNSALTGAAQYGVYSGITSSSSATSSVNAFTSDLRTAAAAFTVADLRGVYVANATKGAGSTITNQHGLYIADLASGTNNYGITSLVSSGTNKWNIYASGTAANYFAGNVGIGNVGGIDVARPLDVVGSSTPLLIRLAGTTADAANKLSKLGFRHYTNAEEDVMGFFFNSNGTDNIIAIGGGSSSQNSATKVSIYTGANNTTTNGTERFAVFPTEAVFNDPGNDYDFRVESDTNTHALFVQGSDGNVGIGTSSPSSVLNVVGTAPLSDTGMVRLQSTETTAGDPAYSLQLNRQNSATAAMLLGADNSSNPAISMNGAVSLRIGHEVSGTYTERLRIDSSGNLISTAPTTPPTLSTNGTMVFNLTSNTNLRISVRGSDGVTRTADITLA